MKRNLVCTVLASLLLAAAAAPALGQGSNPAAVPTPGLGVGKSAGEVTREKAPPALPGARAEPNQIAPAAKNAMELPPNEALFDAINRGDLAVAKDAVNRGADLNATNVLGLTPIELAVDLGRNQLSFYLLSLRGTTGGSSPSARAEPPKPPNRAERLAADREAARLARAERTARPRNAVAEAQPAAPQTARLFIGGGGAPNPQAGFLGFDAAR